MPSDGFGFLDHGGMAVVDPDALQIGSPAPAPRREPPRARPGDGFGYLDDGTMRPESVSPAVANRAPAERFGFLDDGSFRSAEPARHDSTDPSCCGSCGMGWGCDGSAGEGGDEAEDPTGWEGPIYDITCCDGSRYYVGAGENIDDYCRCPNGTPQADEYPCCPGDPPLACCLYCDPRDNQKKQTCSTTDYEGPPDNPSKVNGKRCVTADEQCEVDLDDYYWHPDSLFFLPRGPGTKYYFLPHQEDEDCVVTVNVQTKIEWPYFWFLGDWHKGGEKSGHTVQVNLNTCGIISQSKSMGVSAVGDVVFTRHPTPRWIFVPRVAATASTNSVTATTQGAGAGRCSLTMTAAVSNPTVRGAPAIDYEFVYDFRLIRQTGGASWWDACAFKFTMTSEHDAFPSYRSSVMGYQIYEYNHILNPSNPTPLNLFPPTDARGEVIGIGAPTPVRVTRSRMWF